jgi:multiple sugar transport system substrate-binding protein
VTAVSLRGITWNHSRAYPPLTAVAQRFEELHPQIRIIWDKRSLDEFGHAGLAELARTYDLLIIDHPMLGEAHRDRILVDLIPYIPKTLLAEFESDSLGSSFASYRYADSLYALPVDAAAPAASYRPDLLERAGAQVPQTWNQLIELARRGLVRMPGFAADLFLNFMAMCVSRGGFAGSEGRLFHRQIASLCLEELRELASHMPDSIYSLNPIALYEAMASGNDFAYCPFAYVYSNYARPGFADNILLFGDPVPLSDGTVLRTILGGTGIALSSASARIEAAIEFSVFAAGRDCQRHLYGICGGQPSSRSAWHDPLLNQISSNFFQRTFRSIETAWTRPRYPGYVALQREGGIPIAAHLRRETTTLQALESLDELYRTSLPARTRSGAPA